MQRGPCKSAYKYPALAPGDHGHFHDVGIVDARGRPGCSERSRLKNPLHECCQPRKLNLYIHKNSDRVVFAGVSVVCVCLSLSGVEVAARLDSSSCISSCACVLVCARVSKPCAIATKAVRPRVMVMLVSVR